MPGWTSRVHYAAEVPLPHLAAGFLARLAAAPDAPALEFDRVPLSYAALFADAAPLAATLVALGATRVGLCARRSRAAYVGALACALAGRPYVPLSPAFPAARLSAMADRAAVDVVVADASADAALPALAGTTPRTFLFPDRDAAPAALAGGDPRWLGRAAFSPPSAWRPPAPAPGDLAYILFTSGSTGTPKAVGVTQRNASAFLRAAVAQLGLSPADRFSQTFELGFDLSVFDLFGAWTAGGCVCAPRPTEVFAPAAYLQESRLTVWFGVPSLGWQLERLGLLTPGRWPGVRRVLFCGEALPGAIAAAWQRAAPNAEVVNLYGPTEATVACTAHRFSPADADAAVVPIGAPFGGTEVAVCDPTGNPVSAGTPGELWLGGPQVAPGYLGDPERTAAAFGAPGGRAGWWYRTGDRAVAQGETLHFAGRTDAQVKVRGYRVELGEVEVALARAAGARVVVAAWPVGAGGVEGLVGFVEDPAADPAALRTAALATLPDYMVPRRIVAVAALALTASGKVDRAGTLAAWLREASVD